jgi:hypothetical protein
MRHEIFRSRESANSLRSTVLSLPFWTQRQLYFRVTADPGDSCIFGTVATATTFNPPGLLASEDPALLPLVRG